MSFSLIEDELEKLIADKMNLLECRHSIYLNLNVGLEITESADSQMLFANLLIL